MRPISRLIVVGASQGGFDALRTMLAPLPVDFAAPILVARHQHPGSDAYVLTALARECRLPVDFAGDGELPQRGHVHLAPPDRHLLIDEDGRMRLSDGPKVKHSRPAIDPLFTTAAAYYGPALLAVLLTGGNDDGSDGLCAVQAAHGEILIQDPDSAEAPEMPRAALACVTPDHTVWLDQIGPLLWSRTKNQFR
ncbi:chemotaxis protein CheB [Candidatus Symbiobacter mobilis]|uniref:protein-glutamate methylesterase n=1 Tax=Candidatus Symbiobacter mobilis CR TaxID=946483 RepID=U5N7T5_9BURK|nr:chemotaxis protein CheB [Candidatus Symbiobacter mobilis]AGX87355.1 CheY-like chemotaxis protein [Candidatus Symbiobacter mobilis CR]